MTLRALESYGVTPPGDFFAVDFNRADGTLTTPWVAVDAMPSISGNKVVSASSLQTARYDQTVAADQWAEADLSGVNSPGIAVLLLRVTGGGDFYYFWSNSGSVAIYKRVGGSYSQVGSTGSAHASSFKARLEAEGTTLRGYVDGVLAVTVTDSSIASGQAGILAVNGTGGALDNFRCGPLPYTAP